MSTCKGENCNAVGGVGHSKECIEEHDAIYNNIEPSNTVRDKTVVKKHEILKTMRKVLTTEEFEHYSNNLEYCSDYKYELPTYTLLAASFTWCVSSQGLDYWLNIHTRLFDEEYDKENNDD